MFNIIVKYIVGGAIKIGHLIDGMCIKSYIYQVIVIINLETDRLKHANEDDEDEDGLNPFKWILLPHVGKKKSNKMQSGSRWVCGQKTEHLCQVSHHLLAFCLKFSCLIIYL